MPLVCTDPATPPHSSTHSHLEQISPSSTEAAEEPDHELSDADSEDLPLKVPGKSYFSMPVESQATWLNKSQQADRAVRLENLSRQQGIFDTNREKAKKVIWAKIADKVRIATGPGESVGSKYHTIEMDLININTAKSLFWDLPRTGPTKRGKKTCFNWEVKAGQADMLCKLLSFEEHRLVAAKAWDNAVMRKNGAVMVAVIPPFLVEHQEDKEDVLRLTISFNTLEVNGRGAISWPPKNIYEKQEDYSIVEAHMWRLMYRCWINLPHGRNTTGRRGAWHTMSWRFLRLARRARRAGLTVSDDEELSGEGSSSPEELSDSEPEYGEPADENSV